MASDRAGRRVSLQGSPDTLAGFMGATSKGGEGKGRLERLGRLGGVGMGWIESRREMKDG